VYFDRGGMLKERGGNIGRKKVREESVGGKGLLFGGGKRWGSIVCTVACCCCLLGVVLVSLTDPLLLIPVQSRRRAFDDWMGDGVDVCDGQTVQAKAVMCSARSPGSR